MASDKAKAGSCTGSKENSNLINDECKDQRLKQRHLQGRTTGPTRRSTKGQWTAEEDATLSNAVQEFKGRNWKKIAECFPDRTDVQCLHRWQKVLNPELVKGPWSKEEDDIIVEMVNIHGAKKWSVIAQALPGRIGKQCRERWHNHLNPTINKQAWTQEEEMALIQAHQIYGNKWAELTKFLPGRTDNAIKNHWNSSVKKKLDFYLSSGLLAQFQELPAIENSSQCISVSADGRQQNTSDFGLKEESSECTQGSAQVCCSFSDYDVADAVSLNEKEEVRIGESTGQENLQIQHSPTFLEEYNNSLEYAKHVYPEASQVGLSVNTLSQDFYSDTSITAAMSNQTGLLEGMVTPFQEEPERSLGLSEVAGYCEVSNGNCGTRDACPMSSSGFNIPVSLKDEDSSAYKQGQLQMPETEFSCNNSGNPMQILGDPVSTTTILNLESFADSIICNVNTQNSEAITMFNLTSEPHPSCSSEMCIPNCQGSVNVAGPCLIYSSNGKLTFQSSCDGGIAFHQVQNSDLITDICDDLVDLESSMSPSSHDGDSKNLVHLQTFGNQEKEMPTFKDKEIVCVSGSHLYSEEKSNACLENLNSEALCYEPPRFPSIDIPFLSCDLVSSADILQAYSPLGMRQLTMPSINCSSPYGLWDTSPSEKSPDAFLRNAAKSFLCTPSILKKRQRELLSPLHERSEKKSARGSSHDLFCSISNNIDRSSNDVICNEGNNIDRSSNDVICNEGDSFDSSRRTFFLHCPTRKSVSALEQQGNGCHVPEESRDPPRDGFHNSADIENEVNSNVTTEDKVNSNVTTEDKVNSNAITENKVNSNVITEMKSDKNRFEHHMDGHCISSPVSDGLPETSSKKSISERKQQHSVSLSKPSACTDEKVGSSIDLDFEKLNIFADTPGVKRGIESPSAWKSPWFVNSFLGQRITNDTLLEEMRYFLSPIDKAYDAISLMRHLSEHKAVALTESHEILRGGNSARHSNDGCSRLSNSFTRNNIAQDEDKENYVPSQSNVMVEGRVLDFSGCSSPCKGIDHRKLDEVETKLSSPYH